MDPDELDRLVRLWIFREAADTGEVPGVDAIATALGERRDAIEAALHRLAAARAIVLAPTTTNLWMAAPFSAVATPFVVHARGRRYHGNCIWDALGIAALLHADATIDATCGDCGEPMRVEVAADQVIGDGIVHFAVPAARWWDNIGFT
ncbi:MAG TPA: organomercurial lyase [Kofleriaceae bacterium]|nr:organomercurial lyase [Kofleriaceae bacterium]